ncbi:hypothetical protein [Catellatospora vulcania]|uniref:hypothetical protein n=1 Tax=Catellatospora vulcania TaxID=1460450 RepID=UPI0012D3B0C2|nr:hypothetical protein [Catellatospora vulcania]
MTIEDPDVVVCTSSITVGRVVQDPLGRRLGHGGGTPGIGSHVLAGRTPSGARPAA